MGLIKNNPYYNKPQEGAKFQGYMQAAAGLSSLLPEEENPYAFNKFSPLKGATQGAQLGSALGPAGAIAGAIGGTVVGAVTGKINQANQLNALDTTPQSVTYDESGQPVYQGGEMSTAISNLNNVSKAYDKAGSLDKKLGIMNTKLMRRKRDELAAGIEKAQTQFNQANIGYNQQLLARAQYEDQVRKNNIYNLPMNLV